MYTCIHVYTCTHIHSYIYPCIDAYILYTYIHIHVSISICTIHKDLHLHIHVSIYLIMLALHVHFASRMDLSQENMTMFGQKTHETESLQLGCLSNIYCRLISPELINCFCFLTQQSYTMIP